jgi:O-antigen ligase
MTRRPQLKFPVETFKSIQLWLTVASLTLAPLFFGSVDLLWVAIWAVLLSISTLIGAAGPLSTAQRRVLFAFLALSSAYALVAIVQVAPGLIEHLDDPIWRRADGVLGLNALPRISGRAEIPPEAIGHFLLLVTSFVSGFLVATSRRNGETLVRFARYSILAYAIYGMAALVFTPNLLLWAPKLAYRGSLTATFVNHNTAATFLGAGAILWFCLACLSLQSLRYSSIRLLLLVPSNERVAFTIILHSVAGLVCFVALLLTGSRAGLICTALGLLVAIVLMVTNRLRPRFWYVAGSGSVALALIAGWLSQTGRIGSKGLLDEARWSVYEYCIEAIRQRPLLGAGAGTFADLFPSLRADGFSAWGVWDYAHSTILEIAVEMGIPIAAMVVLAATASLIILVRAALRSKDHSRSSLAAIAAIAVLSYLHSIVDFSLQIPGYLIPFAVLLGCGLARATSEPTSRRRARTRESVAVDTGSPLQPTPVKMSSPSRGDGQ